MEAVIAQFITFNQIEINGVKTFDNMFIALDAEDKIGAGVVYPQINAEIKATEVQA
jgi:hypothetical protein